jgi:hypothetical protein
MSILRLARASFAAFFAIWRRGLVGDSKAAIDEARLLWFTHLERHEQALAVAEFLYGDEDRKEIEPPVRKHSHGQYLH